jgi:hypothetical protein
LEDVFTRCQRTRSRLGFVKIIDVCRNKQTFFYSKDPCELMRGAILLRLTPLLHNRMDRVLLEPQLVAGLIKDFLHFMAREGSLSSSQVPANSPYPESN